MPPYVYVIAAVVAIGVLWVLIKHWRIIVGIVILLIIAIAVKLGFYMLGNWIS